MSTFLRITSPAIVLLFLLGAAAQPLFGQTAQKSNQMRPLPVKDLYRVFLLYQNFLDTRASALQAQGRDESWLRNDLQHRLGFSDSDYAPIRQASQQLATDLKSLSDQAQSIRTSGSPFAAAEMRRLMALRDSYVNRDVANLQSELSPNEKLQFESFITSFFAPKPLVIQPSVASRAKGVQQ